MQIKYPLLALVVCASTGLHAQQQEPLIPTVEIPARPCRQKEEAPIFKISK